MKALAINTIKLIGILVMLAAYIAALIPLIAPGH